MFRSLFERVIIHNNSFSKIEITLPFIFQIQKERSHLSWRISIFWDYMIFERWCFGSKTDGEKSISRHHFSKNWSGEHLRGCQKPAQFRFFQYGHKHYCCNKTQHQYPNMFRVFLSLDLHYFFTFLLFSLVFCVSIMVCLISDLLNNSSVKKAEMTLLALHSIL